MASFHVYKSATIQLQLIWPPYVWKGLNDYPLLFLNPIWKNPHLAIVVEVS
jgi:hypothetical protein